MKKIQIILASTRAQRLGEVVATWVSKTVAQKASCSVELVDLREYPLPALDSDVSPLASTPASELVKKWSKKIGAADGYIIVSPEYNHGYSGVLKNALDTLKDEWARKPVAIIGYGGLAGGARALEQLRLVLIELKMRPTAASVLLPMAWEAFDETGAPKNNGALHQLEDVIAELEQLLG